MQVREATVRVPGGSVWTRQLGDPTAPPLLVLHGGPGMPSDYLEPLAALADDHRVVLFDQLGCGRSERPDDPALWTEGRAVDEVEAVRTALDLGPVHLLGHSWGGYLGLAYADAHPERVLTLVMSSPLVSVPAWTADADLLVAALPRETRAVIAQQEAAGAFTDPGYLAAVDLFSRRHLCRLDPWPEALQRTFQGLGEQVYGTLWGPSEFTQTGTLRGRDLTPLLDRLQCPSLWIAGEHDEARPATVAAFAARAHGAFVELSDASHCAHLERTEAYLAAVRDFLAEA